MPTPTTMTDELLQRDCLPGKVARLATAQEVADDSIQIQHWHHAAERWVWTRFHNRDRTFIFRTFDDTSAAAAPKGETGILKCDKCNRPATADERELDRCGQYRGLGSMCDGVLRKVEAKKGEPVQSKLDLCVKIAELAEDLHASLLSERTQKATDPIIVKLDKDGEGGK